MSELPQRSMIKLHPNTKYPAISKFLTWGYYDPLYHTKKKRMTKKLLQTKGKGDTHISRTEKENKRTVNEFRRSWKSEVTLCWKMTQNQTKEETWEQVTERHWLEAPGRWSSCLWALTSRMHLSFPSLLRTVRRRSLSLLAHLFHLQPLRWARKQEKQTGKIFTEKNSMRRIKDWTRT